MNDDEHQEKHETSKQEIFDRSIVAEVLGLLNLGDLGFSGFCRAMGAVLFVLFLIINFLEDEMTKE